MMHLKQIIAVNKWQLIRQKFLLHGLLWVGLYVFWIMIFQKRSFAFSQTATIEFCYLLFISANFYSNVNFAIPRFLYRQRYFPFAILFISGILVSAALRVPLAIYMSEHYFPAGKHQPGVYALFGASLLNIFIWTTAMISVKMVFDHFRIQQYVQEIKEEKSKAELDFLNAQLNPHFLFNSIHSIYGHIDKNNGTARNMLLTFSDMLRYQLYDCNNNLIPIDKELNYIKNYVALQRARKEEDLVVDFHIDGEVREARVAPLLFICFVENAFKYVGSNRQEESRVNISFARSNNELRFKCLNTKDPIPVENIDHKGIGISNTRRRLALHYPDKHSLTIQENDEYYLVKLTIQLDEMEMHNS